MNPRSPASCPPAEARVVPASEGGIMTIEPV